MKKQNILQFWRLVPKFYQMSHLFVGISSCLAKKVVVVIVIVGYHTGAHRLYLDLHF